MKLGLMTAALPGLTLEEIATWSAANGYEMLEVAAWPSADGAARRYAGVCHLDVERLDVDHVRSTLAATGLELSSLAYYPNNLHPDPEAREAAHTHLRRVVDAAVALDVRIVGTFVGRDPWKTVSQNFVEFRNVWPALLDYAGERGITIAIENCPMVFSDDEWPGGLNLASTPAAWDEMFSICDVPHFALNLDPSHLHWQLIDPLQVVRDYARRIVHVHAKDMELDRAGLQRHGVLSAGIGWQVPRLPGLGEIDWGRFIGTLYRFGYDGVVSVEHEDRAFEGTEELVKRGFEIARDALRPYLH